MPTKHQESTPPDPSSRRIDDQASQFCHRCTFSSICVAAGYHKTELAELQYLVEHVGQFRAGEYIFRAGDPFRAIFAVRRGTVKTCVVDKDGREQVLGFYLPGEVIGLDAIYPDRFPCNAVALDATSFCRFSFPAISALASRVPAVQQHLFRMLSKGLGTATLPARDPRDHSADQRVAAFLMDLSDRYAERGFSSTRLHLSMSRGDIANYLRVAAETVSRVLSRFRSQELIRIDGRGLELLDLARLGIIGSR